MTPKEREEWVDRILKKHEETIEYLDEQVGDLQTSVENLYFILKEAGIKIKNPSVLPQLQKILDKEKNDSN